MKNDTTPNKTCDHGRRSLLNKMWLALGSLALVQVGWIGGKIFATSKKDKIQATTTDHIIAGSLENFTPNSVTAIPNGNLYLARLDNGDFLALSPKCTHLGCTITWEEKENKFICPCHGSTFDIHGEPLTSPATRPLDFYKVRLENGFVKINITTPQKRSRFNASQTTTV